MPVFSACMVPNFGFEDLIPFPLQKLNFVIADAVLPRTNVPSHRLIHSHSFHF